MGKEATKTIQMRLHVVSGDRSWLHDARLASREIFNQTIRLKQDGYARTEIQKEVDRDDFLRNNKCAVVGKALQTWDSYQSLLDRWREQDDPDGSKPTPPSTDKSGAYPLVMAHGEGYRITVDDDTDRIQFRISPKPYKKVKGHLRGEPDAMAELRDVIESDEVDVGQTELLYRDGVYYLHVTVTREFDLPEPDTADTLVGVDINERTVALTALDRDTLRTKGTLVLDYGRIKQERQRYHTITKRCQEHGKTTIHRKLGDEEERFTEWVLHRLSRAVVEFADQFPDPVIVFEDMEGIREEMQYGSYMNRRLHKLPFHKFETFVSYKTTWQEIPMETVDAYYNSQTCSCCGERGYRQGRRFRCTNDECGLRQDHADRNASVNIAWREKAKLDGTNTNYRTHKTQPQVRLVRLSGSGRVSRPTSSRSLAEQGVLAHG
ncbi:RNA-guided endonuclease TnpB family protein [Halosimplex amylolyticum]|uniref:RNA-guided endonuclease TnpB family protein n=1 Tax=Halosimplex amylolyticum TaxID=3396616 RepID=UPI003F558934